MITHQTAPKIYKRLFFLSTLVLIGLLLTLTGVSRAASFGGQDQSPAAAPQAIEFPERTVMVHLWEWKWTDIAKECEEVLGPKGYAAVQVSPPNEHAWFEENGTYPWWLRYQPVSYKIQSRSGNLAEFQDMVNRCHAVEVDIYVDAVINHMTGVAAVNNGGEIGYPGTVPGGTTYYPYYNPANPTQDGQRLFFPFIDPANPSGDYWSQYVYNHDDFHYCGTNPGGAGTTPNDIPDSAYNNDAWQVRNCELVNLTDLKTESAKVRNRITDYFNRLVAMGVAGFRIDAAKHMEPADIQAITSMVNDVRADWFGADKRPYFFLEVIDRNGGEAIHKEEYNWIADVKEFKYEGDVTWHFQHGTIRSFGDPTTPFGPEWGLLPSLDAVAFVVNHDDLVHYNDPNRPADFITFHDSDQYQNANVFMLAWPYGYPKVMSSYNFDEWFSGPPSDDSGNTLSVWNPDGSSNCSAPGAIIEDGWVCEHRWTAISGMVGFKNFTQAAWDFGDWWSPDPNQIAFSRRVGADPALGFVAINNTANNMSLDLLPSTGMDTGIYCNVIKGEWSDDSYGLCSNDRWVWVDGNDIKELLNNSWSVAVVPQYDALAIHVGAELDAAQCVADMLAMLLGKDTKSSEGLDEAADKGNTTTALTPAQIFQILYNFRDKVMKSTTLGNDLITRYYHYSPNMAALLLKQTSLASRMWTVLEWGSPALNRYIAGKTDKTDLFTKDRYAQIETIYLTIQKYGDKSLTGQVYTIWSKASLKSYVGLSMDTVISKVVYKLIGK